MIIIYCLIFLLSLCISYFLLDNIGVYNFCMINYQKVLYSFIIYIFPKVLFLPEIPILLDIGFCISIITDIIEYSVYSIIPLLNILSCVGFALYFGNYNYIFFNIINIIIIYGIFFILILLIKKMFNKDGLGVGDLYFYFMFVWYFDLFFLFLSFFLASIFGLFFILLYKLIFFKKPLIRIIPFIPFLYLSICCLQVESVFSYISYSLFM